jgi:hypothetical protein
MQWLRAVSKVASDFTTRLAGSDDHSIPPRLGTLTSLIVELVFMQAVRPLAGHTTQALRLQVRAQSSDEPTPGKNARSRPKPRL